MSNLIERLRYKYADLLHLEAADEIERLRDVYELADAYRNADFKDQEEIGQELDRALVALEDSDE